MKDNIGQLGRSEFVGLNYCCWVVGCVCKRAIFISSGQLLSWRGRERINQSFDKAQEQ